MLRVPSARARPRARRVGGAHGIRRWIAAAVVDERLALARVAGHDLADEDRVVAAVVAVAQRAVDPGERVVEDGRAGDAACHAMPRNLSATSSPAKRRADALTRLRQHVDGEAAGVADAVVRVRARSMQASTSGGSSDSDATALAVRPHGSPSA
jgi:hypothetical protein